MANRKSWLAVALVAALVSLLVAFSAYGGGILPVSGMLVGGHQGNANHAWIGEEQVDVSESAVTIRIADASLGRFEDSGSMGPFMGGRASALLIKPHSESDLAVGDVIAYESEKAGGLVSHRIVRMSSDEKGWYALAKGDNAPSIDPGKIRFGQVRYVIVGILY